MESLTQTAPSKASNGRRTMTAAVVAAPGEVDLDDVPIPTPGPGQVVVRLEGCGICGSNLPTWQGRDWFDYPLDPGAPGHEAWGVIEEVGNEVRDLEPGTRAAVLSYNAFAQYDRADQEGVVPLPESLDGRPFPGEPLGCAMNVFRRSNIREGQTVAVVGIGFLGALLTQLASAAGARVIAISRRPFSLEVAQQCGADAVIEMNDHNRIIESVKEITGGELCERVIEAVGLQWPLDLAADLTARRGTLVIAGFHQDGPRSVDMQQWNWRGIDVVNAHEREISVYARGIREAIEAFEAGRLDPFPLFTHTFDLRNLDQGLQLLHERPDGFVKALIGTRS